MGVAWGLSLGPLGEVVSSGRPQGAPTMCKLQYQETNCSCLIQTGAGCCWCLHSGSNSCSRNAPTWNLWANPWGCMCAAFWPQRTNTPPWHLPEGVPATWDVLAGNWGLALGPCSDHPWACPVCAKLSSTVAQRNDLHNDSSQKIKEGCLIIFENFHCVGHCAAPL